MALKCLIEVRLSRTKASTLHSDMSAASLSWTTDLQNTVYIIYTKGYVSGSSIILVIHIVLAA